MKWVKKDYSIWYVAFAFVPHTCTSYACNKAFWLEKCWLRWMGTYLPHAEFMCYEHLVYEPLGHYSSYNGEGKETKDYSSSQRAT